jgi:hypothetical protein
MSEWKVSMDVREVMLLDSQDMDYSVKFQKEISKIVLAKRQLHQHELIAMKHNRLLVEGT